MGLPQLGPNLDLPRWEALFSQRSHKLQIFAEWGRDLRILIVTWTFPPTSTMGAIRLGKLSNFLLRKGHDVWVISARDVHLPQTLDLDFPDSHVRRTPVPDVNWPSRFASRIIRAFKKRGINTPSTSIGASTHGQSENQGDGHNKKSLLKRIDQFYMNLVNIPDAFVGWVPSAVWAGSKFLRAEKFDLIFASGPPFVALLIGHILSRLHNVPWVAEFRDRWADDQYYPPPPWRRRLNQRLERHLIGSATAIVTVSKPWAGNYRQSYSKPTKVIYNGYDPQDIDGPGQGSPQTRALRIVHTGVIYPGRRDPTPLFEAVQRLDRDTEVEIDFVGTREEYILPLAVRFKVEHLVKVHGRIPFRESLARQLAADVLLFMQWNDPSEYGNVPGKLFEYLAARRPILGLGVESGVSAGIVRERSAGLFSNDPSIIAHQIEAWYQEKQRSGYLPPLPEAAREGLTRDEQYSDLVKFLTDTM